MLMHPAAPIEFRMPDKTPPLKPDLDTALARIAKMIALLGSPEAEAAFAAIERTLVAAELSWSDVADRVRAPEDGPVAKAAYDRGFAAGLAFVTQQARRPPQPPEPPPRPTRRHRRF
jgi:hypothetical protein